MVPWFKDCIRDIVFGGGWQIDHLGAFTVEFKGFFVARGIVQYQKNLLTRYVLPWEMKHSRTNVEKMFLFPGILLVQPKYSQLVFIFSLQDLGDSTFVCKGSPAHLHKTVELFYLFLFYISVIDSIPL